MLRLSDACFWSQPLSAAPRPKRGAFEGGALLLPPGDSGLPRLPVPTLVHRCGLQGMVNKNAEFLRRPRPLLRAQDSSQSGLRASIDAPSDVEFTPLGSVIVRASSIVRSTSQADLSSHRSSLDAGGGSARSSSDFASVRGQFRGSLDGRQSFEAEKSRAAGEQLANPPAGDCSQGGWRPMQELETVQARMGSVFLEA